VFTAAAGGGGANVVARWRDVACLVDERVGGLWSGSGQVDARSTSFCKHLCVPFCDYSYLLRQSR